jgi:hypothetical protein
MTMKGCDAVLSGRSLPIFRVYLPPDSWIVIRPADGGILSSEKLANFYRTIRRQILEGSTFNIFIVY